MVGVAAEGWCKGTMCFEVKPHYHRTALLPSHCASAVTTPVISFQGCWRYASPPIPGEAKAHQAQHNMRESRIVQMQQCNENLIHCGYDFFHGAVGAERSNQETITFGNVRAGVYCNFRQLSDMKQIWNRRQSYLRSGRRGKHQVPTASACFISIGSVTQQLVCYDGTDSKRFSTP